MYFGFFSLGGGEILVLLVVIIALFGASRIPQLGDALGRGIQNFRKSLSQKDEGEETPSLEHNSNTSSKSLPEKTSSEHTTAVSEKSEPSTKS